MACRAAPSPLAASRRVASRGPRRRHRRLGLPAASRRQRWRAGCERSRPAPHGPPGRATAGDQEAAMLNDVSSLLAAATARPSSGQGGAATCRGREPTAGAAARAARMRSRDARSSRPRRWIAPARAAARAMFQERDVEVTSFHDERQRPDRLHGRRPAQRRGADAVAARRPAAILRQHPRGADRAARRGGGLSRTGRADGGRAERRQPQRSRAGSTRLTGTSSKLDTDAIVAAAYAAKRQPAVRLEQRISRNEARGGGVRRAARRCCRARSRRRSPACATRRACSASTRTCSSASRCS